MIIFLWCPYSAVIVTMLGIFSELKLTKFLVKAEDMLGITVCLKDAIQIC